MKPAFSMTGSARNWFEEGGRAYARFRPEYPSKLAAYLASISPSLQLAVDVGCGNGQLTQHLAPHFLSVIGVDPSADQIANTAASERISYQCAPAEKLPIADQTASLISAAQAAHWFDLPQFYSEVRRIAVPGAILALISYGVLKLESDLNRRFEEFYWNEIGPYWPPERKLVDTGYTTIEFPFDEIVTSPLHISVEWNLSQFLGYLLTWSAVRNASEAGQEEVLMKFARDLAGAWGDESRRRFVRWPVNMRIGKI